MSFLHVFAIESTENQNLIFVHLSHTEALASWEALCGESNELPSFLGLVIHAFNTVNILLGCIRYPAEHIHKAVLE